MGDSDNSEKIEVLNNPEKFSSTLKDNTKRPDQESVSNDSAQKINSNDDNQGENSYFEDNPAEKFNTKEDKPSEQSNSEDNSQTHYVNNDITLKINDGDVSLNNAYEDNKSLLEEENIETQDIDEEIDDAIDEGYMGMECTLERGFSLNESAVERELKEERYDELNMDYFSKSFPHKYTSALKHLVPVRKTCNDKDLIKVDSAGLFSFLTFNWITNIMWKAHKKDLQEEELPLLNLFWEEEIKEKGIDKATLYRPVWRFIRTRILISLFIMICCLLVGLAGPTVFMRYLIEWLSTDEGIGIGIVWVLGLILCEAMRILSFATVWAMNYRTSLRLRGACLGLVYNKLMQMSNLGNTSIGEVINLFANDGQRIHDFVTLGSFFITGILVAVVAICYILYILGPWALLGMISFLFFYPFQYLISRLNGYLRRKTVTITDQRVRMMSEIFSCIKLIKMYAWESCFTQNVTDIRQQERKYLEKSAYVQCLSIAMTPVVPVIAAIITFLAHIGTGNNLTAAQAFSIVALLVGPIRSSLNMVNYSVLALVEFMESAKRLQSILCLKELEKYISKKCQKDSAIEVKDATFAWSSISLPQSISKKNKRDLFSK
ncbi:Multidrug resistance-associated protein 5 [Armadillidium nasatum]|uniref:Multidrug resistance-associated protein 5 n=1 Tax=Armadillidium nasatum TaxID=96803 RepID=A0A5N5SJM6_9CRUS|nr:Multidrug resistance-associated protein 5 [Armadillidium nasatum]